MTEVKFVDLQAQHRALEPGLSETIASVVRRGDFILGEAVRQFEMEWAAYCGVKHAVGVDSGLSALELALRGAGIGSGDEVITQANTFVATAGAILAVGARPVLVDCDDEGQINVAALEGALSPRTRAIMPVHLYGKICDIGGVLAVASRAGVPVIEDACQAHGAVYRGQRAGGFGLAAAFSFYPAKNLGALGDGGILVTRNDDLASRARTLRNYGSLTKYEHIDVPLNHRLDTLQAAVLRLKLAHLDAWNARRQELAAAYRVRLPAANLPPEPEAGRHVYHLFTVQVSERDRVRATLAGQGIETGIHYPLPLHLQPVLKHLGYRPGSFPSAERLSRTTLSLPMYPEMPLPH